MSTAIQHTRIDSALERSISLTATGSTDSIDLLQAGGMEDVHIQLVPSGMSTGNTASVKIQGALEATPSTWVDIETIELTPSSAASVRRATVEPAYRWIRLTVATASTGTGNAVLRILV